MIIALPKSAFDADQRAYWPTQSDAIIAVREEDWL
jgi:hypothetical protein